MTEPASSTLARQLSELLGRAAECLRNEDALGAEEAMTHVTAACQLARDQRLELLPGEVVRLRELHSRCLESAEALKTKISASLVLIGTSRRAVTSYRQH